MDPQSILLNFFPSVYLDYEELCSKHILNFLVFSFAEKNGLSHFSTVDLEIFARVLFSRNCGCIVGENKTLAKWGKHFVLY